MQLSTPLRLQIRARAARLDLALVLMLAGKKGMQPSKPRAPPVAAATTSRVAAGFPQNMSRVSDAIFKRCQGFCEVGVGLWKKWSPHSPFFDGKLTTSVSASGFLPVSGRIR